jgi:hypothetical protein
MTVTKNLVLVIIAVGMLGAAGLVLYNGLFKQQIPSLSVDSKPVEQTFINALPYGESLDFSKVKEHGEVSAPFPYEQVKPEEVGADPNTMIKGLVGPDIQGPQDLTTRTSNESQLFKRSQ